MTRSPGAAVPSPRDAALAAAAASALGVLLVLAAAAGSGPLAGALLLAQAAVLLGWHRGLGVPGRRGGAAVGAASALGAVLLVAPGPDDRPLRALPAVLAGALVGAIVHQVFRRDGRPELTASLTATGAGSVLVALAAMHLATRGEPDGSAVVAAAAVPAALVAATEALRPVTGAPAWTGPVVAAAVALATAAVAVSVADTLGWFGGVGCAAAGAAAGWVGTVLAGRVARPQPALIVALPQVLAAPVGYVASRLLVG